MEFAKEVVLPAALSELLGRLFSFLLESFPRLAGGAGAHRRRLERLLASIGGMVEEAEGRHITNDHLLSHLKALTQAMYRGRFALEETDLNGVKDASVGDDDVGRRRSVALSSSFNSAKRSRVTSLIFGGDSRGDKLTTAIEDLESLTRDCMREFVLLVQGYPRRVVHRSVTTTLYMDRCVFGRHVETERVVNFLLQPAPAGAPYLSVLPIIGWVKAGKTTLVKHACEDERVRGHFSRVECFPVHRVVPLVREGGLPDQTIWESDGAAEYLAGVRSIISKPRFAARRSLLIFEDAWPIDESAWSELASTPSALGGGSKLLFTSRDANLARLGTADPVVLSPLPQDQYWYYFKAFAFGGTDAGDHPRMAAMGKEMARQLGGTFLGARMVGTLLWSRFDARFWHSAMTVMAKCSGRRPVHVNFLLELLSMHGTLQSYGPCHFPPKLTLQDVLCDNNNAIRTGITSGHLEGKDGLTINICRETLYMDHWYSVTLKKYSPRVEKLAPDPSVL